MCNQLHLQLLEVEEGEEDGEEGELEIEGEIVHPQGEEGEGEVEEEVEEIH